MPIVKMKPLKISGTAGRGENKSFLENIGKMSIVQLEARLEQGETLKKLFSHDVDSDKLSAILDSQMDLIREELLRRNDNG